MVRLVVKRGEEVQFLFETTVSTPVNALTNQVAEIYNGRLRVTRLCDGMHCC